MSSEVQFPLQNVFLMKNVLIITAATCELTWFSKGKRRILTNLFCFPLQGKTNLGDFFGMVAQQDITKTTEISKSPTIYNELHQKQHYPSTLVFGCSVQ